MNDCSVEIPLDTALSQIKAENLTLGSVGYTEEEERIGRAKRGRRPGEKQRSNDKDREKEQLTREE